MSRRRAFTLIELLVVISVIALLMAILMPALQKAKKLGQSAVCKAHLRQWGTVFYMYATDNDDKFWDDGPMPGTGDAVWLPMLASLYGNVDEFRLCPSAAKPNTPPGIGTTFKHWGPWVYVGHGFAGINVDEEWRNYSSYGTNLWINNVEITGGWMGQPERQWKTLQSKYAAEIPMIGDCVWFGSNPKSLNDTSPPANSGAVPPSEDFHEQMNPESPQWGYQMGRFCINRHSRRINMTFMDGSTQKVVLTDLWGLKWHKEYEPVHDVEIPWLP